jgi:hypothetical protein
MSEVIPIGSDHAGFQMKERVAESVCYPVRPPGRAAVAKINEETG